MAVVETTAALVFVLNPDHRHLRPSAQSLGWIDGAYELPYEVRGGAGGSTLRVASVTSSENRSGYFHDRVGRVLYGSPPVATRFHRLESGPVGAAYKLASEVVLIPNGLDLQLRAVGVLHLRLSDGNAPTGLEGLTRLDAGVDPLVRAAIEDSFPGWVLASAERAMHVVFLASEVAVESEWSDSTWSAPVQKLFQLASGSAADFRPDERDPELLSGEIHMSRTWRCLVLRNGIAFLADNVESTSDSLVRSLRAYVHSIYLDVLVLVVVQRTLLQEMADAISRVGEIADDIGVLSELREIQRRLLVFRSIYWFTDISSAGRPNEMLLALHRQNRIAELLLTTSADVADLASFGGTLRMERIAELETQRNSLLMVLTVVGLPAALVFAGAAIGFEPSLTVFWIATGIVLAASAGAALGFRTVRTAIRALRKG